MLEEVLSGRPLRLLRMLYDRSRSMTTYTIQTKQNDLAKELGITRQALNVHIRKLREQGHIRTGRGFIDITEKGLKSLGFSSNPAFLFAKISPKNRIKAYKAIFSLPIRSAFRVAGDMDIIIIVEMERLDEVLRQTAQIEGVEETRSYITLESLR